MKKEKTTKKGEIRTRFAPSPTGFFHVGSARTALFNYIFAKQNNGKMILRIEDTDKTRVKKEYEEDIVENLEWLGIKHDNHVFKQSERKDVYKKYIEQLLDGNKAYYCFCSTEELDAKRQEQMGRGLAPHYNGKCSNLPKEEVEKRIKNEKYIIRFRTPHKKVRFNDMIRDKVEFDSELLGDFSIARDTETPLYNLAVVIDDHEMKISHVIRGEDLLPNTPKQILIQEALGIKSPIYAHLPIILGTDRSKLSKRHGATSVTEYMKDGYLPEAIVNFLAFLGWNPGTEKEIFSLPELIKEFSIEKVQKSGAIFNIQKLDHYNSFYIRKKPIDKLTLLCVPYLIESKLITPVLKSEEKIPNFTGYFGKDIVQKFIIKKTKEEIGFEYLEKVVSAYQERLTKLSEIPQLTDYFFVGKLNYDRGVLRWKDATNDDVKTMIDKLQEVLSGIKEKDWNLKNLQKILLDESQRIGESIGKNRGYPLWTLRVALSGRESSASPFEIADALGKEKTLKRLNI